MNKQRNNVRRRQKLTPFFLLIIELVNNCVIFFLQYTCFFIK